MSYPQRMINGVPPAWLFPPRPGRGAQLRGAQIHATRSGISDGDDGPRTENWLLSKNNGSAAQGWGSSCDVIIYESGLRVISNPDIANRDCTYGAGFGGSAFTFSCGWYYEQIEMAQGRTTDPYTYAQIDSLAEYLVLRGYKPVRIPWLSQTLGVTPPEGLCTHEDSENGKRLGKSDPGPLFPWTLLFDRMAAWSSKESDDMKQIMFEGNGTVWVTNDCEVWALLNPAKIASPVLLKKGTPDYEFYASRPTHFARNPLV